jgi:hypothetical protein
MATRSFVGVVDGAHVKYIYVHYDGYPSGVGEILLNYYQDTDKVSQLMDLGDLSSLYPKIGDERMSREEHNEHLLNEDIPQSEKQCFADIRDGQIKDDRCKARETTFYHFLHEEKENMVTEWIYININGVWNFAPRSTLLERGEHILNGKPLIKLHQKHVISETYIDGELLENG